jgi:hypothetical protein
MGERTRVVSTSRWLMDVFRELQAGLRRLRMFWARVIGRAVGDRSRLERRKTTIKEDGRLQWCLFGRTVTRKVKYTTDNVNGFCGKLSGDCASLKQSPTINHGVSVPRQR